MPDDQMIDLPAPKPAALDTTIIALGERAQRSVLDHVLAVGDEAETIYLEVKSSLDVTVKASVAKVAKFLLGAANRRPHEAAPGTAKGRGQVHLVPPGDQQGGPDEDRSAVAVLVTAPAHRHIVADIARMINPVVRGWMAYYGDFYHTALYPVLHRINTYLLR